ncbi:hypothetical protein [Wenjunlia vitaminophila]|uniref:hypothetical protein n=1 Tax=Wenjunlia vitaminophila TaxID=76728 RepID=UPI0003796B6C|nr:hypothetical protein [Wenjunlia vitaminophila]
MHGEPGTPRDEFVRHLVEWARENAPSHRCLVAVPTYRRRGFAVSERLLQVDLRR